MRRSLYNKRKEAQDASKRSEPAFIIIDGVVLRNIFNWIDMSCSTFHLDIS